MALMDSFKQLDLLFEDNKKEIKKMNAKFMSQVALVSTAVTIIAFVGGFFYEILERAQTSYAIAGMACMLCYFLSKQKRMEKYALTGLYVQFIFLFLLVLYLSVVAGIDRPASPMLILLSVFPMLFIDKPRRLLTINVTLYFIHTVCSFWLKGAVIGKMDFVNGLIAVVVGCFFGRFIIRNRVEALNFERLLIMEKETDELTGLHNRRKLFQAIGRIEEKKTERPSGVLMMDIDYFKKYNDTYGHMAGDACLRAFGAMLRGNEWGARTKFYRYGGEEFVAFVWGAEELDLLAIAERIRKQTSVLELPYGKITSSIGYAYCLNEEIYNYETWIERADMAAYKAKGDGRNCVRGYVKE